MSKLSLRTKKGFVETKPATALRRYTNLIIIIIYYYYYY